MVEEGRSPVTKPVRERLARNRPQPWLLSVVAGRIEHMIEALAGPGAGEVEDLTARDLLASIRARASDEDARQPRQLVLRRPVGRPAPAGVDPRRRCVHRPGL